MLNKIYLQVIITCEEEKSYIQQICNKNYLQQIIEYPFAWFPKDGSYNDKLDRVGDKLSFSDFVAIMNQVNHAS